MRATFRSLWRAAGLSLLVFCISTGPMADGSLAQLPELILKQGDTLPNGQPVKSIVSVATNHVGGFAIQVFDTGSFFNHIWGNAQRGPGAFLIEESGSIGSFDLTNAGLPFYFGNVELRLGSEVLFSFDDPFAGRGWTPEHFIFFLDYKFVADEVGGLWFTAEVQNFDAYPEYQHHLYRGDETDAVSMAGTLSIDALLDFDVSENGHVFVTSTSEGTPPPTLDGQPLIQVGQAIATQDGGLPGEVWTEAFHLVGVNDALEWAIAARTSALSDRNEVLVVNGSVVLREGDQASGYTLGGSTGSDPGVSQLILTESGDWAVVWPVLDGPDLVDAVILNGDLVMKEGDFIDLDDDGLADDARIASLGGNSRVGVSNRDAQLDVYAAVLLETDVASGSPQTQHALLRRTTTGSLVENFVCEPRRVFPGESTTLRWETNGASNLSISGIGPVSGPDGTLTVTPSSVATTYTLTASGSGENASVDATVVWREPAVTLEGPASPPVANQPFNLVATIDGATTATLEPGVGPIPATGGVFPVSIDETTTFTLTASNSEGSASTFITVTPILLPTIQSFAASRDTVVTGQKVTLSWDVSDADDITILPLGLMTSDATGSTRTLIETSTMFTLQATNAAGTVTQDVDVILEERLSLSPIFTFPLTAGNRVDVEAPGDINGDGLGDVLLGFQLSLNDGRVTLIQGGLPPTAQTQNGFRIGSHVVLADVNGDGFDDAVVTYATSVEIFFNGNLDGSPDFTLTDVPPFTLDRAGDFNGDGFDDLLLGRFVDRLLEVYFGGPALDQVADVVIPVGSERPRGIGDFNGDGFDDIAADPPGSPLPRIYFGGPGTGQPSSMTFPGMPHGIGDINADGFDDIGLTLTATSLEGAIYLGRPQPGGPPDLTIVPDPGESIGSFEAAGDLNGDGFDDFVGVGGLLGDRDVRVFLAGPLLDGNPDYVLRTVSTQRQYAAPAGDVNGDGIQDLVIAQSDEGTVIYGGECPPGVPCISSFSATPTPIFGGESSTLQWETASPGTLEITPGVGTVPSPAGSVEVSPTSTTEYTLTATGGGRSLTRSTTVVVLPPNAALTASTTTPFAGDSISLTAVLEGATSATLEPGFGTIPPEGGVFQATVTDTTTFVLSATNPAGTTTTEIVINPQPPSATLTSSVTGPLAGDVIDLNVSIQGADSATLEPGFGPISPEDGVFQTTIVDTTTFVLTATNVVGSTVDQITVSPADFIIDFFTATPTGISPGNTSTLSWQVRGAAEVTLVGFGPQPLAGSLVVEPPVTTNYELRVVGAGAQESAFAQVDVRIATPISFSWSGDAVPGNRPSIAPLVPFNVFVVAVDPETGIQEYEFLVSHSDCIVVINQTLPPTATNLGTILPGQRNYLVQAGACLSGPVTELLALQLLVLDQTCIDTAVMALGPVDPSSFEPPSYGYVDCVGTELAFVAGDLVSLDLREPGVSAVSLDLRADQRQRDIQLSWALSIDHRPQSIAIWRSRQDQLRAAREIVTLVGEEASPSGQFLDQTAEPDISYIYTVVATLDETEVSSEPVEITLESIEISSRTRLLGNVPNPFNPQTEIRFELAHSGAAQLEILDAAGRRVRQVDLQMDAGVRSWIWNGRDGAGREVSSGVYYVRLTAGGTTHVDRMALVR